MPRKNKEEYNEYMRNYMKKKSRAIAGKPLMDDDYDASSIDGKPTFDLNSVNKATGALKEVFAKKGESSTEDDPVLKTIEKYAKYIPLVLQFMEGFKTAAKDSQMFSGQGKTQDNTPKAPAGWLDMGAMEKLRFKYSRPEWYAAGLQYDEYVQTGQVNPQVNTSYVDASYDDAAARRREQMAQRQRIASGQDGTNPQSLRELSKKYPEPPLASDSPPMESNLNTASQPQQHDQEKSSLAHTEDLRTSDGTSKNAEQQTEEKKSEETELVKELQLDNARYIQMGVSYLNSLPMEKFKEHIKNIDGLVAKAKPFVPLIPIQVKSMLQITPATEIEEIVKAQCPEKYEWLKKNKKITKLLELFEKLKKEIFS